MTPPIEIDDLTESILDIIVPESMLTADDAAAIAKHKDWLLGLEDQLIAAFYDTLYAHGPTSAVFVDGERPAREQSLREWWQRTIEGPLDDSYMRWMTLVGIIHIRRGVKNPMMVGMASLVTDLVITEAESSFEAADISALRTAFAHLSATIVSLISESFTQSYIGALQNLAGLDPKLTSRMLDIEVRELEENGRKSLANS